MIMVSLIREVGMDNVAIGFFGGDVKQDKIAKTRRIIADHLHSYDVNSVDKSLLTNQGLIELHQMKAVDRYLDDAVFKSKIDNIVSSLCIAGVI